MAKKKTIYDKIGREPVLNGAAVRKLIFQRVEKAFRSEQIKRIDGDALAALDAIVRSVIVRHIDRAIECHPSKFKTLEL